MQTRPLLCKRHLLHRPRQQEASLSCRLPPLVRCARADALSSGSDSIAFFPLQINLPRRLARLLVGSLFRPLLRLQAKHQLAPLHRPHLASHSSARQPQLQLKGHQTRTPSQEGAQAPVPSPFQPPLALCQLAQPASRGQSLWLARTEPVSPAAPSPSPPLLPPLQQQP